MKHYDFGLLPSGKAVSGGSVVTVCRNLRPVDGGGALEPVAPPQSLAARGWLPVAEYVPADGGNPFFIYKRGRELALFNRSLVAARLDTGADHHVETLRGSRLTVYTDGHARVYDIGGGTFASVEARVPLPRLTVRRSTQAAATLPSAVLSRAYTSGRAMVGSDVSRLSRMIADVCLELDSQARAAGLWAAPALMALRVRDASGRVVALTEPQLMCPQGYNTFDGEVLFQSDDGKETSPQVVVRQLWEVELDCGVASAEEYTCEVLATPALQRVDPRAGFAVEMRRRADDAYFCRSTAKSFPTGVWPGAPAARRDFLEGVVGRFESLARVVATASYGGSRAGGVMRVAPDLSSTMADDIDAVRRAMAAREAATGASLPRFGMPHECSGRVVAAGPAATVMASLSMTAAPPPEARRLAVTFDAFAKPWTAVTTVTMADGSRRVTTDSGDGRAPLTFNPVVSYPSAEAVTMQIAVSAGGEVRSETFALRPSADRRRAVAVDSRLVPFELTATAGALTVGADAPAVWRHEGMLAVGTEGGEFATVDVSALGRVRHIAVARHSQGAWDYGRARFLVFTDSGIHSLAVAADGRSASLSRIDTRAVAAAEAVADTGDSICAIASGMLVEISGTKVATLGSVGRSRALAHDAVRRELWLVDGTDEVTVVRRDDLRRYTLGLTLDPSQTSQVGCRSFVGDGTDTFEAGSSGRAVAVDIAHATRLRSPAEGIVRGISLEMSGTAAGCTLQVRRVYVGRAAAGAEVEVRLDGMVGSAVRRPFISRGDAFEVAVFGRAGTDARLAGFEI